MCALRATRTRARVEKCSNSVKSTWELMRVPERLRPNSARTRVDESSTSLRAHENWWERMRVWGQTRARVDEGSNALRAHKYWWECTRVWGQMRTRVDKSSNSLRSARELTRAHESLRPNESDYHSRREFKLFGSAWDGLRPNKRESGREFKLFESAWELMRVHESLPPNESESGREFKLS